MASKMKADPADGKRVMQAIQEIADRATTLLTSADLPRKELISGLSVSRLRRGVNQHRADHRYRRFSR